MDLCDKYPLSRCGGQHSHKVHGGYIAPGSPADDTMHDWLKTPVDVIAPNGLTILHYLLTYYV